MRRGGLPPTLETGGAWTAPTSEPEPVAFVGDDGRSLALTEERVAGSYAEAMERQSRVDAKLDRVARAWRWNWWRRR